MPVLKLDAIGITSSDMVASAKFCALLGFSFASFAPGARHLEPITAAGDVRLMIDDKALIESITGTAPMPPTHSTFAMKCADAAEVDAVAAAIGAAGFSVVKQPWDAFWGQRYVSPLMPPVFRVVFGAYLEDNTKPPGS